MFFLLTVAALSSGDIKCRFSNQTITEAQINDGVCDCCDGSDEFLICPNTCPIVLSDKEISIFRRLYNQGCDEKRRLSQIGTGFHKSATETVNSLTDKMKNNEQLLESLEAEIEVKKAALKTWVYETLGQNQPSEQDKIKYINKDKVGYASKRKYDEEEEEDVVQYVPKSNVEKRRSIRAAKWDYYVESQFKDLLNKALLKDQSGKQGGIVGRLKSLTMNNKPAVYNDYERAINEHEKANEEDSNIRNRIAEQNTKLFSDWTPDHSWLAKKPTTFEGRIRGTQHILSFSYDGESQIKLSDGNLVSSGFWSSIENKTAIYRVPGSPWITKVKFYCHSSPIFLEASIFDDYRIRAEACGPDFCDMDATDDSFYENLRILQAYRNVLLPNTDL